MSNDQSKIKKVYLWIKEYISILLSFGTAILFCLFILVMGFSSVACILMDFTGTADKTKLLEFIGWVMSGFIATLGVVGLLKRTAALDKQNTLTEQGQIKQNEIAEKGHIHERFKAATEHLGNEKSDSVRIASFNEFYRLAEMTAKMPEEKGLKETIFDILCAHLRQTTKHKDYKPEERDLEDGAKEIKPTEEVQSLLNILFKQHNNDKFIFDGLVANLEETNLQGADLREANLQKAKLRKANLQKAHIEDANLQEAKMWEIDLRDAFLHATNLQKTQMMMADLRGARLCLGLKGISLEESKNANLQGALLYKAKINQDTIMPNSDWKKVVGRIGGKKIGIEVLNGEGKVMESIDD